SAVTKLSHIPTQGENKSTKSGRHTKLPYSTHPTRMGTLGDGKASEEVLSVNSFANACSPAGTFEEFSSMKSTTTFLSRLKEGSQRGSLWNGAGFMKRTKKVGGS